MINCCVFNAPSIYRESIYKRIEETFDCDWYFEDTDNKVKAFDTTYLHTCTLGSFYWVKGMLKLFKRKNATDI